ncbi:outer membrane protein assembly factor BamB [Pseudoxanthomonas broegbernensis]|uniref:Outer membrane protein assembly factor BamB n=1 Tax=Pseudoxanthomonas broegbernensis TaxID=83619 RepID=A0A7V8GPU2_9GAMM|nr:outer membrane protein assembly factor BamB [Pseudoxanthomonas broegbernensis]KAF1687915.1 outer membrane protein assembly factor BamB [Pseudoxanthomonas broegbernensis]MBB6064918.1 outer membrane protein assembly factor BamB [Pseudoxanthomonas broegbernensis]
MGRTDMMKRMAVVAALVLALGGCSTIKGWFGGKDASAKKAAEPAELVDFQPTVRPAKLWSVGLGDGERRLGARQVPVVADGRVYAAAAEGSVFALDLQTGRQAWNHKTDKKEGLRLAGGPGVGDGLVAVGSLGGDVIVLDAADGSERWRAQVSSEVIAPPAVSQGLVFVRSNDGRITAFDAASGERRWFHEHELPSLTVRGNAPLVVGPGVLFSGNDDGTLTALTMQDGRVLWEQAIGLPEGRSELERMADVDGAPVLEGTTLYAASFKSRTLAIDGPSGRPMWQSDHGGAGGMGVTSSSLLVSTAAGSVYALDKTNGTATWSQPALARRSLTGAAVQGDYAVVGDFDGYVHWLRLDNGEFAARARVGRKPIKGQPLVADGILLVQSVQGELTAFRLD